MTGKKGVVYLMEVRLENLTKHFGKTVAVENFNAVFDLGTLRMREKHDPEHAFRHCPRDERENLVR